MKKNMIAGIAMAMGILTVGAISASAAGSGSNVNTCADKQANKQFSKETTELENALKAKESELREQYAYSDWEGGSREGIDVRKINELNAEIKALKDNINTAVHKYGIPACSRS